MTITRLLFDSALLGIGWTMIRALSAARRLMNEAASEIRQRNARR